MLQNVVPSPTYLEVVLQGGSAELGTGPKSRMAQSYLHSPVSRQA